MSEWIKCMAEMPAQGQSVVMFSKSLGVRAGAYWMHEPGVHDADSGFCDESGDELFPVTHWQPLPDPPTN